MKKSEKSDFHTRSYIADLREECGLTQRDLAKAVDVTEATIANWERGRTILPWVERIAKLCRKLNCDLEDLILYEEQSKLEGLYNRLSEIHSKELTGRKFRELVKRVKLHQDYVDRHTHFNSENFARTLLYQKGCLTVYVIGWHSDQVTDTHHHGEEGLDVIRVFRGELTHWFPKSTEIKEIELPSGEKQRVCHEPGEKFGEGKLILVDRKQEHQIGNRSDSDLVTVHFRFGPIPDTEDNNWVGDKVMVKVS